MKHLFFQKLRTVSGLSFLFCLILMLPLQALALDTFQSAYFAGFDQALSQRLNAKDKHGNVSLVKTAQIETHVLPANSQQPIPLGQIGELFSSLLILKQVEQGKLQLDEPVNTYLTDFQLHPASQNITLRHLLERSSGLPLRMAGIYTKMSKHVPKLKDYLLADLKPALSQPGIAISTPSMAEILLAQIAAETAKIPLEQAIQKQILDPLGLDGIELKPVKGAPADLGGHDSSGQKFTTVYATAHVIHGWQTTLQALAKLAQAIAKPDGKVITVKMQKHLLTRSLKLNPEIASSSLGLLESSLDQQSYFYIDSHYFGYSLRLAFFPQAKQALVLAYNQSDELSKSNKNLKNDLTQSFSQIILKPDTDSVKAIVAIPAEKLSQSGLRYQDSHSFLKVLNLFPHIDLLDQGDEEHRSYKILDPLQSWQAQLAIALVFGLLFVLVLVKGLLFLYHYDPVVKDFSLDPKTGKASEPIEALASHVEDSPEHQIETDSPPVVLSAKQGTLTSTPGAFQVESFSDQSNNTHDLPGAGWDIPAVSSLIALMGLSFEIGFYFVLFYADRVGDHLSIALRDQPSVWLLLCLALPLFCVVLSLILLALVSNQWKDRLWKPGERWQYLFFSLSIPLWAAWLASWNLLGFPF